jgi:hypothetical protein
MSILLIQLLVTSIPVIAKEGIWVPDKGPYMAHKWNSKRRLFNRCIIPGVLLLVIDLSFFFAKCKEDNLESL